MNRFQKNLELLKEQNQFRILKKEQGIDLTSNDYLGLASDSFLKDYAIKQLQSGLTIGSGGSRLLRGNKDIHEELEEYAAEFFEFDSALFFSSGYQANFSLFTTLPNRHDVILYDSLIHASALDGIHASHAKSIKFQHNSLEDLERALINVSQEKQKQKENENCNQTSSIKGQIWIAIESLYSMDGDFAPIKEINDLALKYDATIIIDEAHAGGVWPVESGKGLCSFVKDKNNIIAMHTCGKAMGVAGALICCSQDIKEYLINKARPYIYSTAPMPLQASLVLKSLQFIASQEGLQRRESLLFLCQSAQEKFEGFGSQIIPIVIGENHLAVQLEKHISEEGIDIRAIRPPTVPQGTARLRLSLHANLDIEILDQLKTSIDLFMNSQEHKAA